MSTQREAELLTMLEQTKFAEGAAVQEEEDAKRVVGWAQCKRERLTRRRLEIENEIGELRSAREANQ